MTIKSSDNLKRYNNLIGELESVYHEIALRFGMSDSVCKIIYTICDRGGKCLLSNLRRLTGLSKQTVNSALRNLEKDGTVYLTAVDGKNKEVSFTEKGCLLAEKTVLRLIKTENEIFASWEKKDVENYLSLTDLFLSCLREKAKHIQ